jgi:hypothetical protein
MKTNNLKQSKLKEGNQMRKIIVEVEVSVDGAMGGDNIAISSKSSSGPTTGCSRSFAIGSGRLNPTVRLHQR